MGQTITDSLIMPDSVGLRHFKYALYPQRIMADDNAKLFHILRPGPPEDLFKNPADREGFNGSDSKPLFWPRWRVPLPPPVVRYYGADGFLARGQSPHVEW
jgi:hypothetical protein